MEMPPYAQRRIDQDEVVWLTTVTDSRAPSPNPVWFVQDGDDLVVFSEPHVHKVHNIGERPTVTLHFNSDVGGGDIVVITGDATLKPDQAPSANAGYRAKYESHIVGPLKMTLDQYDSTYSTEIRIRPAKVRGTPGAPA